MDYKTIYEKNKGDTDSTGLCFAEAATQDGRLNMASMFIARHADPKGYSLLDVGCGFGQLSTYLSPSVDYTGLDGVDWIIDEAKSRYPWLPFICGELGESTKTYDVVTALGVVATMEPDEMQAFVSKLAQKARKILLISYQDRMLYDGSFQSYTLKELENAVGGLVRYSGLPHNDTERTAVWLL